MQAGACRMIGSWARFSAGRLVSARNSEAAVSALPSGCSGRCVLCRARETSIMSAEFGRSADVAEEKKGGAGRSRDTDAYARRLSLSNLLREPAIRSAIRALHLPSGSRGLDAGCGIGLHAVLLAEAVAPAGRITGVDLRPEFLARAREIAEKAGLSGRASFREGDVNRLPFDDNAFDWAWSADTLWVGPREMGCPAEDPLPLVKELARVVKPGGSVAIVFWSSQKLLPGYPLLEARLNATSPANAPFTKGMRPALHCLRALGWLRDAGLEKPTVNTFVADVRAPLSDDIRDALTMTFEMFWGEAQSEVTQEDWAEFQRLAQPASPDFILNLPDYYAFLTYSLFHGKVAK